MSARLPEAASLPPSGIVDLNPQWSRLVNVTDTKGKAFTWHLLDSWHKRASTENTPKLTLLCVHGNPSWSFLWRKLVARAPDAVRVIAVDQLDMGFSQRTGVKRTLATRIDDLQSLSDVLEIKGPVVTVAHDWGGPVSLGWALRHLAAKSATEVNSEPSNKAWLKAVVLTNTAVHQPEQAAAPALIRLIRSKWLLRAITVNTTAFIRGAFAMSSPKLPKAVRNGFLAPYLSANRRAAIADFVADIPLDTEHVSATTLQGIAQGLDKLGQVPALLLWGPRDRVFSDLYLSDLEARLPHAKVHRYPNAAHFVGEDADVTAAILTWIAQLEQTDVTDQLDAGAVGNELHNNRALADFSNASAAGIAVTELKPVKKQISFEQLTHQVESLAVGLKEVGIVPGVRVAVMILPGIDLARVVYACWRLGAVLVLVDSGLGRKGMQNALKSARPDFLIGIDKALVAAKVLGWPGKRVAIESRGARRGRWLGIHSDIDTLQQQGADALGRSQSLAWPEPDSLAAIAFTSGSTGPSKGVIYTHQQIQAQRDQLAKLYDITEQDSLVAAFAPFALYGPTLGISSMVPDMDVTKPSSLSAQSLAEAVQIIDASLVFASPAALVNVVSTANALSLDAKMACAKVRTVLSAGAPVRSSLLKQAAAVFDNASLHTPYGMTEVLPLADISLAQLNAVASAISNGETLGLGDDAGVCVGQPVAGATVLIDPLNALGEPTGQQTQTPGVLGEILVMAAHQRHGYDRLWHTHYQASQPTGFHRSGDVGQLDSNARLWVGGRLVHVLSTPAGPVAPVAYEQQLETIDPVEMAAIVGVGPLGEQVVVAVLQINAKEVPLSAASLELCDQVRACIGASVDVAAVLVVKKLPVDRRHNSKVDRQHVARWSERVLAGDKVASL